MARLVRGFGVLAAVVALTMVAPVSGSAASVGPVSATLPMASASALIRPNSQGVVYLGRWRVLRSAASTVTSGSRVAFAFSGTRLAVTFDRAGITNPPQIWVGIDGATPVLRSVTADRLDLAPRGLRPGRHVVEIAVKNVDSRVDRWATSRRSGLAITAFLLAPGAKILPAPTFGTRRVLFLGDSITEGVRLVSRDRGPNGADATRAYAPIVASSFRARFQQVGYGGQGLLVAGSGGVPAAPATLNWTMSKVTRDSSFVPDVVVVNLGTNDIKASAFDFTAAYAAYLAGVRTAFPKALILAMRPLGGRHALDVRDAVLYTDDIKIRYVDTNGWLAPRAYIDGVHPGAVGHATVAKKLTAVIAKATGWKPATPRWTALASP